MKRILIFILFLGFSNILSAQTGYTIYGIVTDASTNEAVSFATVGAAENSVGTRTDDDGKFSLSSPKPIRQIKITCVGYKSQDITVQPGSKAVLKIRLEPQTELLKEVVVKPKKYRNKNNPTVELIRLVVENRDKNRVEKFDTYQEDQYEKVIMGLSNLSERTKNRKMMKPLQFLLNNVDSTKMEGTAVIPAYMMENIQTFYSRNDPSDKKYLVSGTQKVRFPLLDDDGLEAYVRYLYQDINIYDNYVVLLTDHFLSPIADNAPIFYRYYPVDTIEESGSKIVRLQFFPRNKTDMLLQGELFIALDSTYPVTRINFTVNPNVNLNWVRKLEVQQRFQKLEATGKWVPEEEICMLDFGITKRSFGIFGERYLSHKNPQMNIVIPDSIFRGPLEKVILPGAERTDTIYWDQARHTSLSAVEAATYRNIDSLQNTKIFKNTAKTILLLAVGYWQPFPELGLELGRLNALYSWNTVEGTRLRFGARTNPMFLKRANFEAFGAYGLEDKRWKFGIGTNITLSRNMSYNQFPYNMLRINYQEDLIQPGVIPIGTFNRSDIATSFTRGQNDRFFFQKKFVAQYEKEYVNRFSFIAAVERKELTPLGSLTFEPNDDILQTGAPVVYTKPYVQLRFAPGEQFYQNKNGWRQRVRFNFIGTVRYSRGVSGLLGGQYDFHEVFASAYKFSNLPPIGYNYCLVEAGGVFGKVPYPLLTVHRANQGYGYSFTRYNLMNFMEFVSDRYVALHMEHSFYGFFTNKIPLVRKLKLRELATVKILYGQVSKQNDPAQSSGLYKFPTLSDGSPLTYTLEGKPYIEASIGFSNVFKVLRIELVRRFTYLDHPYTNKYGIRIGGSMQF